MGLKSELQAETKAIFASVWDPRHGNKVPEPEDLSLGNSAVELEAVVLYADISDSTILVDSESPYFAAEIYKAYLTCAARIIKSSEGVITAFDGDRIMALFIGAGKEERAVKAAMQIGYSVGHIINPSIVAQYGQGRYKLRQVVGVDASKLTAARIGIRKYNDLVWVGHTANHAAKLSSMSADYPTYITDPVFEKLPAWLKSKDGKHLWESRLWTSMNNLLIHRSTAQVVLR
jgi:class 3 adenylate cyclase